MSAHDKIKAAVAVILLLMILTCYMLLGKDHEYTRWSAVLGVVIWLGTMWWINNKKKKN